MLGRLLRWSDRVLGIGELIHALQDDRVRPQIPTSRVVSSLVVMFCARLGSLNALAQTGSRRRFWERWIQGSLPSADSLGRIAALLDVEQLRALLHALYTRLKRSKALKPTTHGLTALVIDGHESYCTYNRRCGGCLERRIHTRRGYQDQYFHQHVTAMLLTRPFPLLLDLEPIERPGEELAAAKRLLERLLDRYPRAFDVVLGDALYSDVDIYRLVTRHGKDVLSVLKRNQADLLRETDSIFALETPTVSGQRGVVREVWDQDGFQMSTYEEPVRVLRARESKAIKRQLEGESDTVLTQWYWVTTLSRNRAVTEAIVELGHARWEIENQGFNEMVNRWHADHVYRHEQRAMLHFQLLAMIAHNVLLAFWFRQLRTSFRDRYSLQHLARVLASDLFQEPAAVARSP
jgi:Transposase DDE domain